MTGFWLDVVPVGKPRQTQKDKWAKRPCVLRYRAFADELRRQSTRLGFQFPRRGVRLKFHLPMPASWSAKKKAAMLGQAHEQKPDLDNLVKAVKDALLAEDSVVSHYGEIEKVWGHRGLIEAYTP